MDKSKAGVLIIPHVIVILSISNTKTAGFTYNKGKINRKDHYPSTSRILFIRYLKVEFGISKRRGEAEVDVSDVTCEVHYC